MSDCLRCGHAEEEHDPILRFCEHGDCRCIAYQSGEETGTEEEEREPLDFEEDADR
jgi:hypothetical protein